MKKRELILSLALLFVGACFAQEKKEDLVYLEHSETLSFDEERHPDAQLLKGNVRFRHEDALMYCDSAYFYENNNSLDAFGHVRFVQGDTLFGYGDVLYYNGNTKFARLRRHVKLIHKETVLITDSLNYDRRRDIAWYYTGGTIQDTLNTLTSIWGQYQPNNDQAVFRYDVELQNPNFTLSADTLKYNTQTNIADIVGPTTIVYDEETTIISDLGCQILRARHEIETDDHAHEIPGVQNRAERKNDQRRYKQRRPVKRSNGKAVFADKPHRQGNADHRKRADGKGQRGKLVT